MAAFENLEPLPIPTPQMWSSIGVTVGPELHGGYQSRVFAADRNGDAAVVKLTDGRLVDDAFRRRIDVTASVAAFDNVVVGPLGTASNRVLELGDWLAVMYPLVIGATPDMNDEVEVRRMATTLANLHGSLRKLGHVGLPALAALEGIDLPLGPADFSQQQLLHGDFSHTNVLLTDAGAMVIDFDGCGYGPIEFEVGNTLYMVLFDAVMSSEMKPYERFRRWFVSEYRSVSGRALADDVIDRSIQLRVRALGRWLDDPLEAPIFIRTSTPAWRQSLRDFIRSHSSD